MNRAFAFLSTLLAWPLGAFFLFGAYGNAFISDEYAAAYAAWGYPDWFHYVTALLELAAGILLARSGTRPLGAALGATVMAAATLTTLANGDYAHAAAPATVLVISLATFGPSLLSRQQTMRADAEDRPDQIRA